MQTALALAKGGVEIGAARDLLALAQRWVAKRRDALTSIADGVGRKIIRNQLLQQIRSEFREFVLELELDPGCEKGGAFQQSGDHRIARSGQPAEPFCNAGYFGEIPGLLVEQLTIHDYKVPEIPDSLAKVG